MIDYYEPKIDLTLMGCGFLGHYHIGAILLLAQIWPQKPYNRICGASVGGVVGCFIVAGLKLTDVLKAASGTLRSVRASFASYPIKLASVKQLVEQCLEELLPLQAHKLCSGKLGISLTKFCSFENIFVSQFNSRRDLIDAVVAGCFIPIWSGLGPIPKFMGRRFQDGGFSNNMPKFPLSSSSSGQKEDENLQHSNVVNIAVTPFIAQVDVSPPDRWGPVFKVCGTPYYLNWNNIYSCFHAMLPYNPKFYQVYLLAGHRDMKNFLLNTNMVKCKQCFPSNTTLSRSLQKVNEDEKTLPTLLKQSSTSSSSTSISSSSSSCLFCLKLMEKVDSLKVSQEMLDIFR